MIPDDFRFLDNLPENHDASESIEARDMLCGSGEAPGSSGWLNVDGVCRIASSDTGVSCLVWDCAETLPSAAAEASITGWIASASRDCM